MKKLFYIVMCGVLACIMMLSACGGGTTTTNTTNTSTTSPTKTTSTTSTTKTTSTTSKTTSQITTTTTTKSNDYPDMFKRVVCYAEPAGIYALGITFKSDFIAPKGTFEYRSYGMKGTGDEGKLVNTFTANYYIGDDNLYYAETFWDGKINFYYEHQKELKLENTFGATTRAGYIEVYYTPDGGKEELVYTFKPEKYIPKS